MVDNNPDTNEPISLACLANNVLNQASARPQVPPREISENRPMTSRNLACLPGTPLPETFKITGVSRSEHAIKTTLLDTDFARSLMQQRDNILTKSIHAKETQVTPHHSQEKAGIIACKATSPGTSRFIAPCLTDVQKVLISCLRSENTNSNNTINVEIVARPNISDPDSHDATQESNDDVINVNIKYNEGSRSKAVNVESQNPEITQKHVMTNTRPGRLDTRSEYNLVANESMSSIGSNVCRICMTGGRERLISPCNCKGSLANVHLSCLERWLNQVGRSYCELCGFRYPSIRTPRYTMVEALRLWCGNPRNRHHLQSDCLIFWLLSTLAGGLVAVSVIGTQYFVLEGRKFGISNRVTETVMDFFMTIVLCGYFVTSYLLWKDHYVLWNRWRRASVNVRLIINPDTNFRSLRANICWYAYDSIFFV